jgi:hypothetical protein
MYSDREEFQLILSIQWPFIRFHTSPMNAKHSSAGFLSVIYEGSDHLFGLLNKWSAETPELQKRRRRLVPQHIRLRDNRVLQAERTSPGRGASQPLRGRKCESEETEAAGQNDEWRAESEESESRRSPLRPSAARSPRRFNAPLEPWLSSYRVLQAHFSADARRAAATRPRSQGGRGLKEAKG